MTYALSRVFILVIWLIKWAVIKTRLIFPALFVVTVFVFFKEWYIENAFIAYALFATIIIGVVISWVVTLINRIKTNMRLNKQITDYAYRIAGEPMTVTKH